MNSMHLAIDLRFYRPEPFGIAIHIRDLLQALVPLLAGDDIFTRITLIFDAQIEPIDLSESLEWWGLIQQNSKFKTVFSTYRYYTIQEQTSFLNQLNSLKADLVYFFNFNFPILYNRPFVYQVLDLSIPKTRSQFSLKVQAMLLCFRFGIAKASHILFLGRNTRDDATLFSNFQFQNPEQKRFRPNTIIYNGLDLTYTNQEQSNAVRVAQTGVPHSLILESEAEEFRSRHRITKPYFMFVSVWRKYKNVEMLVEVFERFQQTQAQSYQLVLAGSPDQKSPEVLARIKASPEYLQGNIILPGRLPTSELIFLQDEAEALIAPPLSEGFGLWLVEAATRGNPIICSDIPIFHEILEFDGALFFDPQSPDQLLAAMHKFVTLDKSSVQIIARAALEHTRQFRWEATATTIHQVLRDSIVAKSK